MKLIDITTAVACEPNILFQVNGRSGYFRFVDIVEKTSYNYYGRATKTKRKAVKCVQVYFHPASAEYTDWNGDLVEAQPHRISESYEQDFVPSQITGIGQVHEDGKTINLTTDNYLEHSVKNWERNEQRKADHESEVQRKVETLNAFLGGSYEVSAYQLTDKYYSTQIIDAIVNKLNESESVTV